MPDTVITFRRAQASDLPDIVAMLADDPLGAGREDASDHLPRRPLRKGAWRGQIEAVRVAGHRRSGGIGRQMIEWAIDECRARGCNLVQLTTDKGRADAHRFYEGLGFTGSHLGYKKTL